MRYQSNLPLRARSPNRPTNPLVLHRSQPTTCVLSLASVTVSMKSTESSTEQAPMSVDRVTISVPMPEASKTCVIPFPTSSKRTHSLLRSTPCNLRQSPESENATTSAISESDHGESNSSSDSDFDPPRKRTRTSALSSSSRPRTQRCNSPPIRVAPPPHLPEALSSAQPLLPAPSCATLTPSIPHIVGTATSLSSAPWRRRRWSPGDLRILLYLYRSLVYGLEVKYPNMLMECKSEPTGPSPLSDNGPQPDKSYLDIQDAILAHHLKTHLQESGAAAYLLVVDPRSIAQEGQPKLTDAQDGTSVDSLDMIVDEVDELVEKPVDLPHLHLHPSTNHSVLSYQQLVATLMIRRCLYPRRSPTKLSSRRLDGPRPRFSSKLSHSVSLD